VEPTAANKLLSPLTFISIVALFSAINNLIMLIIIISTESAFCKFYRDTGNMSMILAVGQHVKFHN
jgi:hypothetical protein